MTQDLQRVNLLELSENEKLAFFLNLYNAMVIHAVISVGCPEGAIDRRSFFSDFQYLVGGHPYSLNMIKNGILRCNRRSPYSLVKPFSTGDKRLEVNNFLFSVFETYITYMVLALRPYIRLKPVQCYVLCLSWNFKNMFYFSIFFLLHRIEVLTFLS